MTRRAIITGGSSGIGAATLDRLVGAGFDCLVIGRNAPGQTTTGPRPVHLKADLRDREQIEATCQKMVEWVEAGNGPPDVLINNAGGGLPSRTSDLSMTDVEADLNLNLIAPIMLSRSILSSMRMARAGAIVNIASTAGRTGVPFLPVYSAAKAGLIAFSQSLAAECATDGIMVNCVCPGATRTEMASYGRRELSLLAGLEGSAYEQIMASRTGLNRLIEPDEVARVVCWLALNAEPALNGQTINTSSILSMS